MVGVMSDAAHLVTRGICAETIDLAVINQPAYSFLHHVRAVVRLRRPVLGVPSSHDHDAVTDIDVAGRFDLRERNRLVHLLPTEVEHDSRPEEFLDPEPGNVATRCEEMQWRLNLR